MRLRQNWAVEELVEAFKKARPEVLRFATRPMARSDSPKRKLEEFENVRSPLQKRTRSGRRIQPNSQILVPDNSDGPDEDYMPGRCKYVSKLQVLIFSVEEESRDGLVQCPICQDRMTVKAVEAHIDSCDGNPKSKNKATTNPIQLLPTLKQLPRPELLPHPHYSGLKDTALRRKLTDQGIPSSGPRQLMERRYTEWVTLWNANCDSKTPKGKAELKRELDIWERTQGGRANTVGREQLVGAQIKDKDFDGKAWAEKNDEAFKELIAKARKKPASRTMATEPNAILGNTSDGSTQAHLAPQPDGAALDGQPRRPESQIQYNEQQASHLGSPAAVESSHYQQISTLDKDTAVSSDIDAIKLLQP
jgi:E3 ubiquitin-protein ligase RAD18